MNPLSYRVVLPGVSMPIDALFASFEDALAYSRRLANEGFEVSAIINDSRTDGGARQGLTSDEYLAALEVVS